MSRTVVVIGGGYGGSTVAKALDEEADVVLIEPKDQFVHACGSLRALVRPDWAGNIFFPYDNLLRRGRVIRDRAASVDAGGVTLDSGARIEADYIVLASGSGYPYPAKMDTDVSAEALEKLFATHAELAGAERVLLIGAGPVGLELAGEIKAVWPGKHVTLVDPAAELVPGYLPQLRQELHRQLDALGVEVRLGTALTEQPPTEPARLQRFTAATSDGGKVTADIWFRCHGVSPNSDYLGGSLAAARTAKGHVRVTEMLNVEGHQRVYAIGDITDVPEAKRAGSAQRHADVVARNIIARARGEQPAAVYRPVEALILPLGPNGGVGQVPAPDGPRVVPPEEVAAGKGADLYAGRYVKLFGTTG